MALADLLAVDPSVIDPSTGVPKGLSYDPESGYWKDASGNQWRANQDPNDPSMPTSWQNITESAKGALDATGIWAQRLGIQDPGQFMTRLGSQTLTPHDMAVLTNISSVAPQYSGGKLVNGPALWNDTVTRAEDQQAAPDMFGINGLGPIDDNYPLMFLASVLGGAAGGAGGAAGEAGAGAADAADLAGGLMPEYGTTAAYNAGIGTAGAAGSAAAGSGGSLADTLAANAAGGLKVAPEAASLGGAVTGSSGAMGVTGLTPGLATEGAVTGLGGGLSVPGVTGAGSAGAIGAAGAGLGTGYGLAEALGSSAAPAVTGGAAAGGTALGTAGTAAAAGAGGAGATKVGDLVSGNVSPSDLASNMTIGDLSKTLGTLGLTAGSIYGDTKTADALKSINDQYMAIGAPSRARYEASFDPNFDINSLPGLKGAMDTSTQTLLRQLSATGGNPFGNPGGLAEALKYVTGNVALPALQNYRNQNASSGGFGAFSTAAPGAATGAVTAGGNVYADLGRGAANIFNPPTSLQDALKSLRGLS